MSKLESDVLKINSLWQPIGVISVRQAFSDASAGAVTFLKFTDGYPSIFRLEDWLLMEVGDGEDFVSTSKMHNIKKIAIPRVVITVNYSELLAKEQPCNPDNLLRRYKNKDAITGKDLSRQDFSREHVRPRSKGGQHGWENEVPAHRNINSRRGNKSYRKFGFKKPKILGAPPPMLPIHTLVNREGHNEWDYFHIRRNSLTKA